MRGLIVEVSPVSANTSIAHVRNMLVINSVLKFDLIHTEADILSACAKPYDVIVFSYSAKFAPHDAMRRLCDSHPDTPLVWVFNDYVGTPPKCLRDRGDITVICNNDQMPGRDYAYVGDWHTINLNALIMGAVLPVPKKYGAVYYGTYRPDREVYFREYLHAPVFLSSSAKNHKLFRALGCTPTFIEKLSWRPKRETLRLFDYSLIMEDVATHAHYSHLPNRFYESVWCDTLPVIDVNCAGSVLRSGMPIPDGCYVGGRSDVARLMASDTASLKKQLQRDCLPFMREEHEAALRTTVLIIQGAANGR